MKVIFLKQDIFLLLFEQLNNRKNFFNKQTSDNKFIFLEILFLE